MSALMTESVASTVVALDESGGATLTELARTTGRPVSTVQRSVESLVKAGLVVRPIPRGVIQLSESAPRRALRELADWRLAARPRNSVAGARDIALAQAVSDIAEIRRLMAMSDRDREAYFFASNRNLLRMFADAGRQG